VDNASTRYRGATTHERDGTEESHGNGRKYDFPPHRDYSFE
jgi:hypothetical protein